MSKERDGLMDDGYVPSSIERKKALLMYFFVGIVAALARQEVTVYEMFHLKQSLGRWMVFFICLIGSVIFVFIPYLRVIPLLVFVFFLVIRCVFVKQAREGRYVVNENMIVMPVFEGLGGRVVSIFELDTIDEI